MTQFDEDTAIDYMRKAFDIVAELIDYVTRMLRKDKLAEVKPEHVKPLVLGELAYEDFLDSQM